MVIDSVNQILEDHVNQLIDRLNKVDIVIGIPSYNNSQTIKGVITNYAFGLKKYYPGCKSLIVNSDGGSIDDTVEIVEKCHIPAEVEKISTHYRGIPGKGSAFKTIFEIARKLEAKVCVVSDADTRSICPEWTYALVDPVLGKGYGYVNPYYSRDKHDGTITNALVYPMTRMLYGLRIRQPIGGDFSFSNGLLQIFTRKTYWKNYPHISKFGVDIWMTTTAINEGFRVCQAALGAKIHDDKDPGRHLADMYVQVVGTMFELIGYYEFRWKRIMTSVQGTIFGDYRFFEIEKIDVDIEKLLDQFNEGYKKYSKVWKGIFSKKTFQEFKELVEKPSDNIIHLSVELWVKIVYEYASAYNFIIEEEKEILLKSMLPLYFLRTASFIREAEHLNYEIADAIVEGDAGVFERLKKYFRNRWSYYKNKKELISVKDKIID
ncbi:glycosyl transferase family 2 [Actinomycetota bacterium]